MNRSGQSASRALMVLVLIQTLGWRPTGAAPSLGLGVGWPTDPAINVAIVDTAGDQAGQRVFADAGGGVFVSWDDPIRTWSGLRLQRLTSRGAVSPGWPPLGMLVADTTAGSQYQVVVGSGPDAVIAAWLRNGVNRLLAQRVDTNGVRQWSPGGVDFANGNELSAVVAMPDGGAMFFFRRDYLFAIDTVYVERLDGSGAPAWPQRVLCDAVGWQRFLQATMVSDSEVVVSWQDGRTTPNSFDPQANEIYAQKLKLDGTEQWAHNGIRILTEGHVAHIVPNWQGGFAGSFIYNENPAHGDLKIVDIGSNGQPMPGWPINGLVIENDPNKGGLGGVSVSPTDGSLLVVWWDAYQSRRPWAQKVDALGNFVWPNGGVPLFDSTATLASISTMPDGDGGMFVTLEYPLTDTDIFAQHVRTDGSKSWPGWGVPVSTATGVQWSSEIAPDSSGGAFFCWYDFRNASYDQDLYAQHVNADGSLGGVVTATEASAVEASYEGGCARIVWYASNAAGVEFTVERDAGDGSWAAIGSATADGTGRLTHRDCGVQQGATYAYRLEWNDDGTVRSTAPISLTVGAGPRLGLALPAPNPILREATVEFTLPRGAHVRLEVLDLAGRRVATILDGNQAAGVHRLAWRPVEGVGGRLAPGCYVLRLSSEGSSLSRRVVVLR